jgi:hypothetical protein
MGKRHRSLSPSRFALAAGFLLFSAWPAAAQQPIQQQSPLGEATAQGQSATQDPGKQNPGGQTPSQGTHPKDDRLFWTLPNLLTVENASHVPALTAGQKFRLVTQGSFDPVEYPYIGFLALISQAENSEPGFRQGAKGYAKRYGASFADNTIENYMTGAILPTLLREDPRYYQLGKGGFFHRAGYSVSRIFVTRTDAGQTSFNFSEILGSGISAGLSNAYHPAGDRTVANTISVWWTQVGWDTISIVAKEFWPDIRRMVSRKRAPERETGEP